MSAFEVDETHIHFLLAGGLGLADRGSKLRWLVRELTDEEKESTFQPGEPWGPGASTLYGQLRRELNEKNAGWVGAMLLAENRRSVNHRYREEEWEQPYVFKALVGVPSPVALLKAIDCFVYQSCEHPEWDASEANRFCDSLRQTAIRKLPGYEDKPWEVTEENLRVAMTWSS